MKLPQSFLDLHAAGRFDYWGGKQYHDMDDAERARLLSERRNEVLWLRGIEWDVEPEGVGPVELARPGLFGFAGNGGGDQYAWYPAWQGDAPEPPVILVVHDEYVSKVFAPSFALTLYRLWLEHAADWDDNYDGNDRTSALRAWAGIIAPVLDDETRATLEALTVDLAPAELRAARDAFVASLPSTELHTALLPTRYNPTYVKGEDAKRAYGNSIAFFEALVNEGLEEFRAHIEETRANRDAALALEERAATPKAAVSTPKPEKAAAPKAKPAKKAAKKAAPKKAAKKAAPKKAAKKAAPKKTAAQKAIEKVEKALVTAAKAAGKAVKKAGKAVKKAGKKAVPKKAAPKKAKAVKKAAPKKAAKKAKKAAAKKAVKKAKPVKKAAPKKAAKKSAPRKAAKAKVAKKAAPKKAAKAKVAKKAAPKKAAKKAKPVKKAAPKKAKR